MGSLVQIPSGMWDFFLQAMVHPVTNFIFVLKLGACLR